MIKIVDISDYESKSLRMEGFRKPALVGLKIPSPMIVVPHESFKYYFKHKKLHNNIVNELYEYFDNNYKINAVTGFLIRRGFYVPGIKYPPGPRGSNITKKENLVNEIIEFYEYAINNNYNINGADIGFAIHPFIHPYFPLMQKFPGVPYPGGCVTPSKDQGIIIIESLWGHDEAVQSYPHDKFYVNYKNLQIIEKNIQKKDFTLKGRSKVQYSEFALPPSHQNIQSLNDLQVLEIAQDFNKVYEVYGNHRLEFNYNNYGINYTECTEFTLEEDDDTDFKITNGSISCISEYEDINKINTCETNIVYITNDIVKNRKMDVMTSLAVSSNKKLIILYPGTSTTAHSATIFREQGHTIVYTKNQDFQENDFVEIGINNGELEAKVIKNNYPSLIFMKEKKIDNKLVGNKALRLHDLNKFSFKIPTTVVVNSQIFESILKKKNVIKLINKLDKSSNQSEIKNICKEINNLIKKEDYSKSLKKDVGNYLNSVDIDSFAVRSSSSFEDSDKSSFAGQFDTYVNVDKNHVLESIKKVWLSVFNLGAILYAKKLNIDLSKISMSVIIQEMINSEKAGVIYISKKGNGYEALIEAVNGECSQVVDGVGDVEKIKIVNNKIIDRNGLIVLNEKQISNLYANAKKFKDYI